jgi:hypothetical protein
LGTGRTGAGYAGRAGLLFGQVSGQHSNRTRVAAQGQDVVFLKYGIIIPGLEQEAICDVTDKPVVAGGLGLVTVRTRAVDDELNVLTGHDQSLFGFPICTKLTGSPTS